MRIAVAASPSPGEAFEIEIELPAGASVRDAVEASGVVARLPGFDWQTASLGVFGRPVRADATLGEGDRVEVYRALAVDPKEARRRRVQEGRQVGRRRR